MTIDGIELQRLEHAEAAKDPNRFTPLWEGIVGSDVPPTSDHLTVIVQVLASDGLDPAAATIRVRNLRSGQATDIDCYGLATSLTISSPNLTPTAGAMIQISAKPVANGGVWVDLATATLSPDELAPTTPPDLGPPPAVVLAGSAGDGQVLLTWDPPPHPIDRVLVRYRHVSNPSWSNLFSTTELNGSFSRSGFTNGEDYLFELALRNTHGDSDWSNQVTITPQVGSQLPPDAITTLAVTG